MAPSKLLTRNVRPGRVVEQEYDDESVADEELDGSDEERASDDEGEGESEGSEDEDEGAEDGADGEEDAEEGSDREANIEQQIANTSFGTLKQAHEALSKKRKRGSDANDDQNDKLEALRKRLRQIKEAKAAQAGDKPDFFTSNTKTTSNSNDADNADDASDSDDSAPSEEGASAHTRTSKHAPRSQSTRHQVTRKRAVVEVPKRIIRDPRFDAVQQRSAHSGDNMDKAYSFLYDYQKSEISDLKLAAKTTVDEDEKAILRRKVNSMENRLKAKASKEREQEVLRAHRREEKGRVEQGKTPYFLKKKEVKDRALVAKFEGMKGKEREKIVEKRRKKEAQKEIKRMPGNRRVVG